MRWGGLVGGILMLAGCEGAVRDGDLSQAACAPSTGGPYWIEEGQPLVAKVQCAAGDVDAGGWRASKLPAGARFDRRTGTLTWTPHLDQAGVYSIALTLPSTSESTTLKIGVADAFDRPGNAPVASPAEYSEELGLPVLHLTAAGPIGADDYTPATIVYRGHTYRAQVKIRGNSSADFPKNHYTIKFGSHDPFGDPDQAGGFVNKTKISLRSAFDDNSYVRERMAYELWNRVGTGKIRMQSYSAVVYLNGAYQGLYTVVDHIDADLMGASGLAPDGNLFKSVGPAADFRSDSPLTSVYEKVEGTPPAGVPGAFDDLRALTDFVDGTDDASFAAQIGNRLALGDYRAWYIVATAISAGDTLTKNAYHYHDPAAGPWRMVPWDFNESWGQDWQTFRMSPDDDPEPVATVNRLFERLIADPVLGPDTRARYAQALRDEIPLGTVLGLFDRLVDEVAASARRDERRWRQQYLSFDRWRTRTDFTTFTGEVGYVRRWIEQRWGVLESEFLGDAEARKCERTSKECER